VAEPYSRPVPLDALPHCPAGLLSVLEAEGADVVRVTDHAPRYHVRLDSPGGPLFAWYSGHPDDAVALRHELAVRAVVGHDGVLRAPPVLASGPDWRVERMIVPDPLEGPEVLGLVVRAWQRLTELDLPRRPSPRVVGSRAEVVRRRLRLLRSPLPTADLVRARRLAVSAAAALPAVTSHGDFHGAHVLPKDGVVYVIDWEVSGRAPLGLDLMQLWAGLPRAEDRGLLLGAAVDVVGPEHRGALLQLRYVALVRRIASKLAELRRFGDPDPEQARALLALLPEVRAQALSAP
jgi:hypothetical protein